MQIMPGLFSWSFFLFFSHNLTCRAHRSSVGARLRRRLLLSSTKTHSRGLDQLKLSAGETWDTMFPSLLLYQVGEQPISYGMRAGSSRRAGYLFKELTMNQESYVSVDVSKINLMDTCALSLCERLVISWLWSPANCTWPESNNILNSHHKIVKKHVNSDSEYQPRKG